MKNVKIEGIATISKRGFCFNSGIPSEEPVLDVAQCLHGKMKIERNGCAEFVDNGRVYLPPEVHSICSGDAYKVRRTTRNYIIQLKVPVTETRAATQETFDNVMPVIMGEITLDRKELFSDIIA